MVVQLRTLDCFVVCGGEPIEWDYAGWSLGNNEIRMNARDRFLGIKQTYMDLWWLPIRHWQIVGSYFYFYFILTLKEMLFKGGPRCCIVLRFASTGG